MSDRYVEILRDSRLSWNSIPSGRQLPRTPPLTGVKKHLDFCNEDTSEDHEEPQHNMEPDTIDQDDNNQNVTFDFNTNGTKTEPDEPNSMLKGMKGYQLTQVDLEFIEKMKVEKLIKKLQGDLKEVQRLLNKEMMPLELALASREKAQADLKGLPSCEDLMEWAKAVLRATSPSTELTDLDLKSLLDMVTRETIRRVTDEKRVELKRMENMVENKRKREAKERGCLEKQIASEQLKIHRLMNQLSNLKSECAHQEEAYKALEMQINTQEAPEIKSEDASEELEASKTQARGRGKGRTKAVKSTEKFQDAANQSKRKLTDGQTDNQTSVKYDNTNKNTRETLKTKQKPAAAEKPTKSVKEARGPQKEVEEQEADSQEFVRAVRGRRKQPAPTEATSMSRQEAPSQGRKRSAAAAGGAEEESHSTVLRRSKRIASRR